MDYIRLQGAEQVQDAANQMTRAADRMVQAANTMDNAVTTLLNGMHDSIGRLETLLSDQRRHDNANL